MDFKDADHAKKSGGALGHAVIQTVANKMINALKKHSPNSPAIAKFQKLKRDSMTAVKGGGMLDDLKGWIGKNFMKNTVGKWFDSQFPAKEPLTYSERRARGGKLLKSVRGGSFNSFMNNLSSGILHGFTLGLL